MTTKSGDMPKMYVLKHSSGKLFKGQNLYLGIAELTDDIDKAEKFDLCDAERKFECMREKEEWKIFTWEVGLRLGKESSRHLVRKRKLELEKELAAIAKADGEQQK